MPVKIKRDIALIKFRKLPLQEYDIRNQQIKFRLKL